MIKTAILIALVAFVLAKSDLEEIARHFTAVTLIAMLAIQPFVIIALSLAAVRFATLTAQRPAPIAASFKAIVLCYGANLLLPARVSEILKATYLRQHAGLSLGAGIAAVFLERVADLLILGSLALVAAVGLLSEHSTRGAWMALSALVLLGGLPWLAPYVSRLALRIPSDRLREFLYRFIEHSVERITHRAFAGVIALSALMWLSALAGIALMILLAGNISIGISGALVVFLASIVGGAVPALPGGFGTYEAAVVFALRGYGYEFDEAIALALSLHFSHIAIFCVLAPLIALREKTGVRAVIHDALEELKSAPSAGSASR